MRILAALLAYACEVPPRDDPYPSAALLRGAVNVPAASEAAPHPRHAGPASAARRASILPFRALQRPEPVSDTVTGRRWGSARP
jgi:hypothetical protein